MAYGRCAILMNGYAPMLFRNAIWSLLGEGLPMAAALVSIPLLVSGVGMERFGALTFIWALLGMLAICDLGLVRALIQLIAERRGDDPTAPLPGVVGPALALMAVLGVVAGGAVALASGFLAHQMIQASGGVAAELRHGLLLAAAIVPVALVSAGLRGVLEAQQRFRDVNIVRIAVGVANYLSPVLVLAFSDGLVPVLAAIAVGRLAGLTAFAWLALRREPGLFRLSGVDRQALRPLFSMSAWMMVNNLLGPLMLYADRFVLAGSVPAAAIAFYTTPFEMAIRLLFIPTALSGVLFPAVAGAFRVNPAALNRMLLLGGFAILAAFIPLLAVGAIWGGAALHWWLGPVFAENSGMVLSVLLLGLLLNATAYIPYALIQGIGRMDLTARLQLAELPVYFGLLWLLVDAFGPLGAAVAWTLRVGADLLLLLFWLPRLAPQTGRAVALLTGVVTAAAAAAAVGLLIGGVWGRGLLLGGLGCVLIFIGIRLARLLAENGGIAVGRVCCYVASAPSQRG